MRPRTSLIDEAREFAEQLTATVQASVEPNCTGFQATLAGDRVAVRQTPREGIALKADGQHIATLKAAYRFDWDREGAFLAVHESTFKVYPGGVASGEPLFRYEFTKDGADDIPNAHLHVHGQRDALAYVMNLAGRRTQRGKRRAQRVAQAQWPTMSDLHFPVGGDRFRPALEDVLQILIEELGVDCEEGWRKSLAEGRKRWRLLQTASAVRDSP